METALEFYKLEKIELGGIQGKQLTAQVLNIHTEFIEQYKHFSERTYDCLDTSSHVSCFSLESYYNFRNFKEI